MEKKRKERGFGGVAADLETSRVHKNRPQMLSEAKKEYIVHKSLKRRLKSNNNNNIYNNCLPLKSTFYKVHSILLES